MIYINMLSWNGAKLLEQSVPSLMESLGRSIFNWNLTIIDNNSTDNTDELLEEMQEDMYEEFGRQFDVLNRDEDHIISKGWNAAIHQSMLLAEQSAGYDERPFIKGHNLSTGEVKFYNDDYVVILNNDMLYHPNQWLDRLMFEYVESLNLGWNVGIFGPDNCMVNDDYKTRMEGAVIDGIHGSSFVIPMSVIHSMENLEKGIEPYPGIFDENIAPCNWEDVDYVYRLEKQGYSSCTYEAVSIFHLGGQTIYKKENADINKQQYSNDYEHINRDYFNKKHGFNYQWGVPVSRSKVRA